MEHDDLMKSMDEGVDEKKAEILKKAETAVKAIRCDARSQAEEILKSRLSKAVTSFQVERNRTLYAAKNESNKEMAALKQQIFLQAFVEAGQRLGKVRDAMGYEACYRQLVTEALAELGDEDAVLHVDARDQELCGAVLAQMGARYEIAADLRCGGGMNASTRDGKVVIYNTMEARLEQAKDRLKLDIFSLLYGD